MYSRIYSLALFSSRLCSYPLYSYVSDAGPKRREHEAVGIRDTGHRALERRPLHRKFLSSRCSHEARQRIYFASEAQPRNQCVIEISLKKKYFTKAQPWPRLISLRPPSTLEASLVSAITDKTPLFAGFIDVACVARYETPCASTCLGPRERLLFVYRDFQPWREWDIFPVLDYVSKCLPHLLQKF